MVFLNPPGFSDWPGLMALLRSAFAVMEGRINPPSSLDRMTLADLRQRAETEDLFLVLEDGRPVAVLFARAQPGHYYLGKLAVCPSRQGGGLARCLIEAAADEAGRRGLPALVLQTRVELRENHRAFRAMGFRLVGASAHTGFSRATSLTFRRDLSPLPLSPARPLP